MQRFHRRSTKCGRGCGRRRRRRTNSTRISHPPPKNVKKFRWESAARSPAIWGKTCIPPSPIESPLNQRFPPLATVKPTLAIPPQYQRPHAQNTTLSTLASPLNQHSPPLATVQPTLKQRRLQQCTAKATPLFSIFFHILCEVSSGVEVWPPLPTTPAPFWR